MERFILFAYYDYYPDGGMNDVKGSYATLEMAIEASKNINERNKEIFDCQEREVVWNN